MRGIAVRVHDDHGAVKVLVLTGGADGLSAGGLDLFSGYDGKTMPSCVRQPRVVALQAS